MSPTPSSFDAQSLLSQANAFHGAGRLAEAERLYAQILALEPGHFAARHLLGVLRYQQGRHAEALTLIGEALTVNPVSAEALVNQGVVLAMMGRFEESLASYDRSLVVRPDNIKALNNRGCVLWDLQRFEDALASYDRALVLNPDLAETLDNRGNTLSILGRTEDALSSYARALAIKPDFAQAACHAGFVLQTLRRIPEALAYYDMAVAIQPNYLEALIDRGTLLSEQKLFAQALANFDGALVIDPGNVKILVSRGTLLLELSRFAEALASYDRALAAAPNHVLALNGRGNALRSLGRFAEALASYDKAAALEPNLAWTFHNRGSLQWAENRNYDAAIADMERVLALDPSYEYAQGDLLHLKMYGADWQGFAAQSARIDAGVRAGQRVVHPFIYQAISESPSDLKACAVIHAAHRYPPQPALAGKGARSAPRIRVGYVCGEFRQQATSLLSAGLYECHDRDKFEIVAFDNGVSDQSPLRTRLEAAFDKFVPMRALSGRAAAERIAAEEIDILVNLNGYYGAQRMDIFAHRPAPLQVNYLGFPGTLGADYIDYLIADRLVIPPDEHCHYAEKIVTLPPSYQVNDSRREVAAEAPSRAECGLPEHGFVFCNFNQSYKLTPATFDVWMRVLNRAPGSVLWLPENNTRFQDNLRREAQSRGVAGNRIVFAPHLPSGQHLARLRHADLLLDSLPYNAHTTASDALFANVPVLTCPGTAFAGRVGESLLQAIGLPELVAASWRDYENLAVMLAGEPERLAALKAKLARQRETAPLFDTPRFARNLERAYGIMWERFREGLAPSSFQVEETA